MSLLFFLLIGQIPLDGKTKNMTVCQVGFSNECAKTYEIEVKNCTKFLVYKLKPLDSCDSAYCFGTSFKIDNSSLRFTQKAWHARIQIHENIFLSEINDDCKYIFMFMNEYIKFNFENHILSQSNENIT